MTIADYSVTRASTFKSPSASPMAVHGHSFHCRCERKFADSTPYRERQEGYTAVRRDRA